ncbi:MAG: hypothetical protein ACOY4Q_05830 [Bacillota bacterium]
MKDKFLLGSLAGIAGALVMVIANILVNMIPGLSVKLFFGVTYMFVPPAVVNTLNGNVIAILANLACGGVLGVIFTYFVSFTNPRYMLLKGAIYGGGTWFLICGMIARALRLPMVDKPLDQYMILAVHFIYGIVTAYVIARFGEFEKAPEAKEMRL